MHACAKYLVANVLLQSVDADFLYVRVDQQSSLYKVSDAMLDLHNAGMAEMLCTQLRKSHKEMCIFERKFACTLTNNLVCTHIVYYASG